MDHIAVTKECERMEEWTEHVRQCSEIGLKAPEWCKQNSL